MHFLSHCRARDIIVELSQMSGPSAAVFERRPSPKTFPFPPIAAKMNKRRRSKRKMLCRSDGVNECIICLIITTEKAAPTDRSSFFPVTGNKPKRTKEPPSQLDTLAFFCVPTFCGFDSGETLRNAVLVVSQPTRCDFSGFGLRRQVRGERL